MKPYRQIRADFDRNSVVVYQAYSPLIAKSAAKTGRFQPPFSWERMTWIKPSFLWLMARSGWGRKRGQERALAIRIKRTAWESALARGVLTHFEPQIHHSESTWRRTFHDATIHVQWDPERSLAGTKMPYRSIQVGVGSEVIRDFTDNWVLGIKDLTEVARRVRQLCRQGKRSEAKRLLPRERPMPLPDDVARRLLIT